MCPAYGVLLVYSFVDGDIPPVPNGGYYDSLTSTVNTSVLKS